MIKSSPAARRQFYRVQILVFLILEPLHEEVDEDVRIARYQVDYIPDKAAASPLLQPWSESVAARK